MIADSHRYYQDGWPNDKSQSALDTRPYWNLRNEIFVEDGLLIYEDRVIVPEALRYKVLQTLHAGHQGVEKTKLRARQVVYWLGINSKIQNLVSACRVCERYSAAIKKERLIPHEIPKMRF